MLKKDVLRKAINNYVENYSIEANFSPRTVKNKRSFFNRFFNWLAGRPYTIQNVRAYILHLYEKGSLPNTILDEVRMLRALTNFLFNRKYIKENFASQITKPKVPEKDFPDISQDAW